MKENGDEGRQANVSHSNEPVSKERKTKSITIRMRTPRRKINKINKL